MSSKKHPEPRLAHFFRTRNTAMRELLQTAEKIVDRDANVLILGESGTGKDYLAQAIHASGPRRNEPFVVIECASIPSELFESELYGHERGTFTDAYARKIGKLEMARRGTVYFDEIAALELSLQAKLLRAIQEKRFTRLGGAQSIELNARVISSSNRPLDELTGGALRRDLFYRINVVTLTLPPLRERREDIPQLAKHFIGKKRAISADAMEILATHTWPGNLRELRNILERASLMVDGGREIEAAVLPHIEAPQLLVSATRERWTLDELESRYIREILRITKDNNSKAAVILGINRKTLREKRRRYGIT